MIRDRGLKKWQGFFMPEHTKMLKDYNKEQQREKQPLLDEQKIEEMNEIVAEAMEFNLSLTFTVYNKRFGCFEYITGIVHYVDVLNKHFRVIDENEVIHQIHFNVISDVYRA